MTCRAPAETSCADYQGKLPKTQCLAAGQTYAFLGNKWVLTDHIRPGSPLPSTLNMFHVVNGAEPCDARLSSCKTYGVLFVGVEQFARRQTSATIALGKNKDDAFNAEENKTRYSRSVERSAAVTSTVIDWLATKGVGNLYDILEPSTLKDFDFPQGVDDKNRIIRARLYRYQKGSLSCIPFDFDPIYDLDSVSLTIFDAMEKEPRLNYSNIRR